MKENQLSVIVEQSGLETNHAQSILKNFTGFFEEAQQWEQKARKIVVTDVSQTDIMNEAREARLALKEVRVNAEKVRKELKEQSLREGKAIDGIANVIKALVVPLEEHLEKQEKFVEYKIAKELDDRNIKRVAELTPFVADITFYNLRDMDEDSYQKLLKSSQGAYEAQKKAEEEVEQARIRKEEEDKKERERIQKENEELKRQAEKREEEMKKEREMAEAKARKEQEEREALEAELKRQAIKISKDGDRYCVLYGENLQKGISGFGDTIEGAITAFCEAWLKTKIN